jgi:hypothetical protein
MKSEALMMVRPLYHMSTHSLVLHLGRGVGCGSRRESSLNAICEDGFSTPSFTLNPQDAGVFLFECYVVLMCPDPFISSRLWPPYAAALRFELRRSQRR